MSTNNEGWVKFSEREPRQEDYPIWVAYEDGTVGWSTGYFKAGTRWQRAIRPAPPKEETQREKDEEAFHCWYKNTTGYVSTREGWHAALNYERADVAKLFRNMETPPGMKDEHDLLKTIHKRCTPS